jgi:hypothetical protein
MTRALKRNSTLRVLHLGDNRIRDAGAQLIAEMLLVNSTIEVRLILPIILRFVDAMIMV